MFWYAGLFACHLDGKTEGNFSPWNSVRRNIRKEMTGLLDSFGATSPSRFLIHMYTYVHTIAHIL